MSFKNQLTFSPWRVCLLLVCSLTFTSVFSQIEQVERYEIAQRYSDEDFNIIPLQEDGLALFRKKFKFNDRNRIWELIHLDTHLNPKRTLELEVDNQGELTGYEHSNGFIHLLFIKNEIRGDMEVISVNLETYTQERLKIMTELKISLTHFNKCGKNFILGGDVGDEPAIFIYTPSTNNFKIVPGFFKKRTELIDVRVNENQTFNTVLISRENRDSNKIIFKTFDSFGKQLIEDIIAVDDDHYLQTGMSSNLQREDLMILGTWGNTGARQSSGFYAVPVNPFAEQPIKFSYLGQLEHYLDHMKPKRAEKIKLKTKKAIEKGSDPDYANYIVPHKILEHEKGFVLLAETYIPSKDNYNSRYNPYTYSNNQYGSRYGNYYPGSGMYNSNDSRYYGDNVNNTQEIKTIQSQVILFNAAGEALNDYSIKMDEVRMPTLNQISDFYLDSKNIYFLYKKESELFIKTIDLEGKGVVESVQKVKMKSIMDVIRSETNDGRIRHWYGSSFYMYGYQTVKFEDGKVKDIFYINRVAIN
jgi:hypothetical protein